MKCHPALLAAGLLALASSTSAQTFPGCNLAANERLLEWPAVDPVWQLCYLRPSHSSGPRGSGLEIRNAYFRGRQVFKRAHAPMLFAEYRNGQGGNCYRDWKDENSSFLANTTVQNQLGSGDFVRTSCDRSNEATTSYGTCPFQLTPPMGASCFTGVSVQDQGDRVTLTTQYVAGWYLYSSRFILHDNGVIEPLFGFGNSNGTYNSITHWHHNYWRFDFDIGGPGSDALAVNGVIQTEEFSALRGPSSSYDVIDVNSRLGYRVLPGSPAATPPRLELNFPANESGRNQHSVDVIGTEFVNGEFSDRPNNNLSDCSVVVGNLVQAGVSTYNKDVVLYYRGSVRDSAGDFPTGNPVPADPMVCKSVGPTLVPIGPWGDQIFAHGTE